MKAPANSENSLPLRPAPQRRSVGRRVTPERLERILDVTVDIVIDEGFSAVTMQSVARRADYVRPVVYDCYGSPENILAATFDRAATTIAQQLEQISGHGGLAAVLTAIADAAAAEPRAWRLIGVATDGSPDAVRHRVGEVQAGVRALIGSAIHAGAPAQTSPPLDVEVLAAVTQGLVDAFVVRLTDASDPLSTNRIRQFIGAVSGATRFTV